MGSAVGDLVGGFHCCPPWRPLESFPSSSVGSRSWMDCRERRRAREAVVRSSSSGVRLAVEGVAMVVVEMVLMMALMKVGCCCSLAWCRSVLLSLLLCFTDSPSFASSFGRHRACLEYRNPLHPIILLFIDI